MLSRDEAIALASSAGAPLELQEVNTRAGVPQKWFVNGPQTLRELYEQNLTDATFFVYDDERYTFRDSYQLAANLACYLRDQCGVKHGDRVAIAMRNYPEWAVALQAITSLGGIAVALNAWWQPEEMEYAINLTETSVIIADQERIDRISKISPRPDLPVVAVRTPCPGWAVEFERTIKGAGEMPAVELCPDDDAVILFTSGSTGHPKGSVSTHRNILAALLSWELDYTAGILQADSVIDEEKLRSLSLAQNSALLAMPLFHVNGMHAVLFSAFRTQRKIVSMYKWDPALAADLIDRENIAQVVGTPAMTGDLVDYSHRSGRTMASLQSAGGGGAPRATSQVKGIKSNMKNAVPFTGWGMTETNSIGTGIYGQDYLDHPASSGRCSAILEIATIDSEGCFLPRGERGELVIRGTSIIHGYWNRPDANAESYIDGWFRTGDVAYVDEEGYLYVVDRIKQLIIRGGENIGCGEVEEALLEVPQVVEACVYGLPDERLGETVAATLYIGSDLTETQVTEFLASRLAKFKIPDRVEFSTEPLPRIASGKIDKRVLQQQHQAKLGGTGAESQTHENA